MALFLEIAFSGILAFVTLLRTDCFTHSQAVKPLF